MTRPREVALKEFQESIGALGNTLQGCAPLFYGYYRSLREQGFEEERAFQMVRDLQVWILNQGNPKS